jgi:predicted choloylglycine hydrolase
MKTLSLKGDHYEMGRQHGHQVLELREMIAATMEARLCRLEANDTDVSLRELGAIWQDIAPSTLAMLRGMADGLRLPFPRLFAYAAASYLDDLRLGSSGAEGCTVWAASRSATPDGSPILTKNRDYAIGHLPLQALAYAVPRQGYRSVYVTSAGSPAVFSSGMNERGLAVADTHVSSRDIGPGLSRYTLMMNLLEQHADVASALAYLREVPQMGAGNMLMADAAGELAACESGYRDHGVLRAEADRLVATNHFVSAALRDAYLEGDRGAHADSQARYETVWTALQHARGGLDVEHAKKLMAGHANHGPAICRHKVGTDSGTISNVIFLPAQRRLLFCSGFPCQGAYTVHSL